MVSGRSDGVAFQYRDRYLVDEYFIDLGHAPQCFQQLLISLRNYYKYRQSNSNLTSHLHGLPDGIHPSTVTTG